MPYRVESSRSGVSGDGGLPPDPFLPPPQSRSLLVEAIARSKWILLVLAAILGAAGVAVGLHRTPTWSSSAQLQVGAKIDPNSAGFSNFVQSETALTSTFSRAITAPAVLAQIGSKTGLSADQSATRISATPVPDTAAINVIGTGPSAAAAMRMANVGASALVNYESTRRYGTAATIFNQYRAQTLVVARAKGHLQSVENANPNDPTNPDVIAATANEAAAEARANALSGAYAQALANDPTAATDLVTPLSAAVSATNDRLHKIELFGLVGLGVGLLIGTGVGIVREQRRAYALLRS